MFILSLLLKVNVNYLPLPGRYGSPPAENNLWFQLTSVVKSVLFYKTPAAHAPLESLPGLSYRCKEVWLKQCSGFTILAGLHFINSNCSCPTETALGNTKFICEVSKDWCRECQYSDVQGLFYTPRTDPLLIPGPGQHEVLLWPNTRKAMPPCWVEQMYLHQGELLHTPAHSCARGVFQQWFLVWNTFILKTREKS